MQVDTVLIKVASRCNINCKYCYVYHLGDTNWSRIDKLLAPETITGIVSSIKDLVDNQAIKFSAVLHGGEPLMLGALRLREFLTLLRSVLPDSYPISLQTNGVLITKEILDVCSEFKTSLAVSIDGPSQINDIARLDHKNQSTFDRVISGITLLENHPDSKFLYAGLLAVVDPTTDPAEVYGFFKDLNAPSVDFLYKDGNHSHLPPGKNTIGSTEYGLWMSQLLDIYLKEKSPIPIRVFDDMLKLLIGGGATKEGIGLSDFGILIFDTDGTITKNDTLKSAYEGADRFETKWSVGETRIMDLLNSEEYQQYHELQKPTSSVCLKCPELQVCGGGMTVHRWMNCNGFDNPTVYCADQLLLISNMRKYLIDFGLTA